MQAYMKTLEVLWSDLTRAQMYVNGGVGARSEGEAFGEDYELPNAQAYGESCAAIGNAMWNWRMLAATGEARFTDVMERALYNGINSGMSLNGTLYCYRNPLAFDPTTGEKIRNPWYDTTCCPPNLERTFASLPGYFYSTAKDGLYVHLYDNSKMQWKLESGNGIVVTQKTQYPWEGCGADDGGGGASGGVHGVCAGAGVVANFACCCGGASRCRRCAARASMFRFGGSGAGRRRWNSTST